MLLIVIAGRAGVRRDDGAADRRRRHAGGHLAAERLHRHRGGDGRVRDRQQGADHRRRAGRRVRRHPDQADGRRDEPLACATSWSAASAPATAAVRGRRAPGGDVRSIAADDAAIQLAYAQQGHHRARLRPGRRAGPARGGRAGRRCWRSAGSRSATPSTRWPAGCPAT